MGPAPRGGRLRGPWGGRCAVSPGRPPLGEPAAGSLHPRALVQLPVVFPKAGVEARSWPGAWPTAQRRPALPTWAHLEASLCSTPRALQVEPSQAFTSQNQPTHLSLRLSSHRGERA